MIRKTCSKLQQLYLDFSFKDESLLLSFDHIPLPMTTKNHDFFHLAKYSYVLVSQTVEILFPSSMVKWRVGESRTDFEILDFVGLRSTTSQFGSKTFIKFLPNLYVSSTNVLCWLIFEKNILKNELKGGYVYPRL